MRNLIKKIIKESIQHIYQPTGNSCGPTCLKMVHDYFIGDRFKVDDICHACGTDWVVGTPPDRMNKGLDYMGIEYVEHISDEEPFQELRNSIDRGHPCIIRTITQGVPHWIVAVDYTEDSFMINDPWLGKITYTDEELNDIWHMRDYFFYEVTGAKDMGDNLTEEVDKSSEVEISHFKNQEEMIEALRLSMVVFKDQGSPDWLAKYMAQSTDWEISVKATYRGRIVGFYFLNGSDMIDYINHYMIRDYKCYSVNECNEENPNSIRINPKDFEGLEGIEGVALGVDEKYKGLGIGKKLIEYSQTLPYDYIWGQQYENLGNIEHWTKRREIAAYFPGLYITYQML